MITFKAPLSPGNRLKRMEQSGIASSEKENLSMKQRESVKLKDSTKNALARAKGSSTESLQSEFTFSTCVFANDSIELKLA